MLLYSTDSIIKIIITLRDHDGDTPLMCASDGQNNTELVELLLEAGAEVNPILTEEVRS